MSTRTFLFVDQKGSTEQLTRLGDEATQRIRRALFDVLRQATEVEGGHEVDFTGDGLFCAFEGAAEAVAAAVSMQQLTCAFNSRRPEVEHLSLRIGLHTGEPLESEGGGYFGAAVVVAARLCTAATGDRILVSSLVRALVEPRGTFRFEPVGQLDLKGVPEPVETSAVVWEPDGRAAHLPAPLAAAREGAFVGRARELAAVQEAWAEALAGARRLVLVSGDSGIGATRLAAEAAGALHDAGASVWAGTGQGSDARLAPWAEAVRGWVEVTSRAELRLAVGERGTDLLRLLPALAEAVPGLTTPAPLDPAAETFLVADALDELVARWSAVEPLVVVLDRLGDADQATLTVVRRLLDSRRPGRLLVIGCYEPAAVGAPRVLAALADAPGSVDLRLEGLPESDVGDLLEVLAGERPSPQALRAVLAESEGNPYFVLQMSRSLRERHLTHQVQAAVDRAGQVRNDLRLQREEIALGIRQLEQLRESEAPEPGAQSLDPDGTPPRPGTSPYRGLLPFRPEDGDSFVGRDALVAEMVAAVASGSWLAVLGPSGSGKSSAVRAGLIPALRRGALPGSESWTTTVCTPGPDPLAVLTAALDRVDRQRSDVLLVIDQFEELWTTSAPAARTAALDLVVDAVHDPTRPVRVVVSMRADHYDRVAEHPGLAALMSGSQVLVSPMTTGELRAAIELPARRAGLVVEPGLAQAVVDDLAGEAGALPLLSTTMQETWERRRGRSLTLTAYAETGGARRAIATMADRALAELTVEQQDVARRLLLRLAAPGADGSDVARPAALAELAVDDEARLVLDQLAARRLVTVGGSVVQVAHEALLREWPRLRGWLQLDREGRRLHQQIATAATQWDAAGRDDDGLLRGARLAAATEWSQDRAAELTPTEHDYLATSAQAGQGELRRARRTTRRLQMLAAGLVVLLVGAAVATVLAVSSSRDAAARATEATARGLAAQAIALGSSQVDTALLLAVEGYRRDASLDTDTGLLSALDSARFLVGFPDSLPGDVADLEGSRDGSALAVLTTGGQLRLFDATTLEPLGDPLVEGIEEPFYLEYSPDGATIAYSDLTGVHLVDAVSGAPVGPDLGPGGIFDTFSFASDGSVLAIAGGTEVAGVRVVDLRTGAELTRLDLPPQAAVAVRPGSQEFVATVEGGFLQRFSFTGSPLGASAEIPVSSFLTYTPDGSALVAATLGSGQLYDPDALTAVGRRFSASGSRIVDLVFSPDSSTIALSSDDGGTVLVDTVDGTAVDTITGLSQGPTNAFLDDTRLLSISRGGTAALFDLAQLTSVGDTTLLDQPGGSTAALPGGDRALLGQGDELVEVDSAGTLSPAPVVGLPILADGLMAVSPDGGRVALVGLRPDDVSEARLVVADLADGSVLLDVAVPGSELGYGAVAFSPDGDELAVSGFDGRLAVVDSGSGDLRVDRELDSTVVAAVSWTGPDQFVVGGQDGVLLWLDPGDLAPTDELVLTPGAALVDMALVPGTDQFAVTSEAGTVTLVDAGTHEVVGDPLGADGTQLQQVAVSPDGATIAATSRDGALRLWERSSGRALGPPLRAHRFVTSGLVYLADGGLLTSAYAGSLVAWSTSPADWVDRACALVGRDLTASEWQRYLPDQEYRRTCTDR